MNKTPGIDMTVGSLGQGISAGLGMALSGKMREKNYHVWVVVGDGECQEGSVWEAAMAGAKWKLDNLTVIVDKNRLQNDSYTDDIMPLGSLVEKWKSFGWNVLEIDGNDMQVIVETFDAIKSIKNIPTAVIAHTIKGKGVSFMENTPKWHSTAPDQEEAAMAIHEIMGAA